MLLPSLKNEVMQTQLNVIMTVIKATLGIFYSVPVIKNVKCSEFEISHNAVHKLPHLGRASTLGAVD